MDLGGMAVAFFGCTREGDSPKACLRSSADEAVWLLAVVAGGTFWVVIVAGAYVHNNDCQTHLRG